MRQSAMQVTDDWIIQRFLRLARQGEDEDLYEPWPGYTHRMTEDQALKALAECETRWPDHEFRAHRVRVHEKLASEAVERARKTPDA
jgi:hypothetical protein